MTRRDHDRDKLFADDLDPELYAVGPTPGKLPATARLMPAPGTAPVPFDATAAWATVQRATVGTGTPLPALLRSELEGAVATSLGEVRIHTGQPSAEAAAALGAR